MICLLLVDIQNDFLPGGALEVPEGDKIIDPINLIQQKFDFIIATQDFHPKDHKSFASNHKNKKVGDIIKLNGLDQILWPDHCIENSYGAEFSSKLNKDKIKKIFPKGTDKEIDSYSGFFDNGGVKKTGLDNYLKNNNIRKIFIVGLATDYCVKFTALDSLKLGYKTYLLTDCTKGVNIDKDDVKNSLKEMEIAGIKLINSVDIDNYI